MTRVSTAAQDESSQLTQPKAGLVAVGLPKTRSGKILRGAMPKIADGEAYLMLATIEDPTVLKEIEGLKGPVGSDRPSEGRLSLVTARRGSGQ
jgi:hypothetical protein